MSDSLVQLRLIHSCPQFTNSSTFCFHYEPDDGVGQLCVQQRAFKQRGRGQRSRFKRGLSPGPRKYIGEKYKMPSQPLNTEQLT